MGLMGVRVSKSTLSFTMMSLAPRVEFVPPLNTAATSLEQVCGGYRARVAARLAYRREKIQLVDLGGSGRVQLE